MAVSSEPTRVRRSGRKPRRLLLCLLLAVCGAPALASASPTDPLHVPGIYDDADHDDVVVAILSLTGVPDDSSPTLGRPARVVTPAAVTAVEEPPSLAGPAPSGRAPPT